MHPVLSEAGLEGGLPLRGDRSSGKAEGQYRDPGTLDRCLSRRSTNGDQGRSEDAESPTAIRHAIQISRLLEQCRASRRRQDERARPRAPAAARAVHRRNEARCERTSLDPAEIGAAAGASITNKLRAAAA
jgi:hypothetical protein